MRLAIMQPYFAPYIGYWQLINVADIFVVYDNIQFSKSGWFHRNNILVNGTKKLFTIPLERDSDYLNVVDRHLAGDAERRMKIILAQIENSYRKAPCFKEVFPLLEDIFQKQGRNLFEYIFNSIRRICEYLSINTEFVISSEVAINHDLKSQDKVIAINKALKASNYINAIGGVELYDMEEFKKNGLELEFLEAEIVEYSQFDRPFEPYMSIIDIMMFNNPEQIQIMLNRYRLKRKGNARV